MSINDLIAKSDRSQGTIWLNKEGEHILDLKKFSTEELPQAGQKMIAKFEVVESEGYPSGAVVSFSWDVYNNKPIWRDRAIKDVKTFLCELLGKDDVSTADIEAVESGKHEGTRIKAVGVVKPPRPKKDNPNEMTKPFTNIYFHNYSGNEAAAVAVTQTEQPTSVLGQLSK